MAGTESAFDTLILPHRGALAAQARRLTGNSTDAEDLVQETLLRAYNRLDTLRGTETVRPWLQTILRNVFINMYHRNGRSPRPVSVGLADELDTYAHTAPDAPSTERVVLSRLEGAAILKAVGSLPAAYRDVLVLSDVDGLSYQEIAERLHLPVGTVRSRLSRARQRVARSLYSWRNASLN